MWAWNGFVGCIGSTFVRLSGAVRQLSIHMGFKQWDYSVLLCDILFYQILNSFCGTSSIFSSADVLQLSTPACSGACIIHNWFLTIFNSKKCVLFSSCLFFKVARQSLLKLYGKKKSNNWDHIHRLILLKVVCSRSIFNHVFIKEFFFVIWKCKMAE